MKSHLPSRSGVPSHDSLAPLRVGQGEDRLADLPVRVRQPGQGEQPPRSRTPSAAATGAGACRRPSGRGSPRSPAGLPPSRPGRMNVPNASSAMKRPLTGGTAGAPVTRRGAATSTGARGRAGRRTGVPARATLARGRTGGLECGDGRGRVGGALAALQPGDRLEHPPADAAPVGEELRRAGGTRAELAAAGFSSSVPTRFQSSRLAGMSPPSPIVPSW